MLGIRSLVPVFAAAALIVGACDATPTPSAPMVGRRCAAPYPSGPPSAETVFCADPAGMQAARVGRIIDGDTLDVVVSGTGERVRLFGIDTPERGAPCYGEATNRLRDLAGDEVRLRADDRNRVRSGRLLRYVFTPEGISIDAILVDEGLALAWTKDGVARDAIVALEALARSRAEGCLWR